LDAGARIDIRRELRGHLADSAGARLLVTHDPIDASVLADRVVILEGGRVVQDGPMAEIALHPRSRYVADLVGLNLYRGIAGNGVVAVDGGGEVVVADHGIAGEVHVAIHPRAVGLHVEEPAGSARNHWPGHITEFDDLGDRIRVRVDGVLPIVAEVTRDAMDDLDLTLGRTVIATAKAAEVQIYPA
jgi:molybdate transport system ATP-binding protein